MLARIESRYERLALERQARDLALCALPGGHPAGFRYDEAAGQRVVDFVEGYCKHHKGEWSGRPLILEEWQRTMLRIIFGWLRADGTRRFRTAYIEIGRKNGKSELAAALGLYLLVADHEDGAEIYSSATKKDQAAIVWSTAVAMVRRSPKLKRFVRAFRNNLHVKRTDSKFEPLGADSNTLDGLNPHGNIVDELHAHKDRGVWDVLDSAMGARRQPLTLAITTAGKYDPESIGWEQHEYARKVLEREVEDDSFFAFIASADEGETTEQLLKENPGYYFTDEALQKANPNYGVSAKVEYLQRQAKKAQVQPGFHNEYLTKHCNVWVRTVTRWLSMERWAQCEPPADTDSRKTWTAASEREKSLEGRACYGGLDLSSKLDLTAGVLVFPGEAGDAVDVVCRFWLPEGTVHAYAEKGQRHYETWVRQGWLTTTPGDVLDYDFVRDDVKKLHQRYKIRQLGFDPWGAVQISNQLMGDGITMVEVGQGYKSMSEPAKELEALVVARKLRHAHNPILRFCAANATTRKDPAGNIKPDKERSKDRIDGVVALTMALSRIIVAGPTNPYEERGVLVV